ncbi:PREDICTED: uncharacterized protein LOC109580327 [Amphimedon queenslandica]|uniref:Death domain-containing protein n=1 Tax=Amphimedon queenslandica TaxID=400682 RepID=A0AAN0IWV6_AMPQE|nr:PREDICTED: uncharacterized protein LOC109580327 [Amphimedon queenslandica]|eukprot:XP_019848921.1 PREDICTED: uncharacterized protein LOC109580327 [Amphimedon queenslandica]
MALLFEEFDNIRKFGIPQMEYLLNHVVVEIPSEWEYFGTNLKIPGSELEAIKMNVTFAGKPDKMFFEVLRLWEKAPNCEVPFTWGTILRVLVSPSIHQERLAEELKNKLISDLENKTDDNEMNIDLCQGLQQSSDSASDHGYYDEDDLKKLCSCGDCSLEKIITEGCSNPDSCHRFPILDVKKLPGCKKQQYLYLLMKEAKAINEAFASLLTDVCESMKKRDVSVKTIALYLKSSKLLEITAKSGLTLRETLDNATDIDDVFSIISDISSWFNHHPLGLLINKFGTEEDKTSYETFLEENVMTYLKRSITEIPKDSFGEHLEGSGDFKLKLDHTAEHENICGSQIYFLKGEVAKALDLPMECLKLDSIDKGCLEITLSVPLCVHDEIFPLKFEQAQDLANIIIDGNFQLTINSIWYQGSYHDIPFKIKEPITSASSLHFSKAKPVHKFHHSQSLPAAKGTRQKSRKHGRQTLKRRPTVPAVRQKLPHIKKSHSWPSSKSTGSSSRSTKKPKYLEVDVDLWTVDVEI